MSVRGYVAPVGLCRDVFLFYFYAKQFRVAKFGYEKWRIPQVPGKYIKPCVGKIKRTSVFPK